MGKLYGFTHTPLFCGGLGTGDDGTRGQGEITNTHYPLPMPYLGESIELMIRLEDS